MPSFAVQVIKTNIKIWCETYKGTEKKQKIDKHVLLYILNYYDNSKNCY